MSREYVNFFHKQIVYTYRLFKFAKDLQLYRTKLKGDRRFLYIDFTARPFLFDQNSSASFDEHYFYHCAWAARVLAGLRPAKHIDISSILDFSGIVSAFIPIDYYEFQVPNIKLSNFRTAHIDLLKLPFDDNSIESISTMHVVEHVGLGRYGDPIDTGGDLKAVSELQRVVCLGGHLLFVVPISGKARIEFNAHRVYTYNMVVDMFPLFALEEFALIPDSPKNSGLIRNASKELSMKQYYGCGCFLFKKSKAKL